MLKRFPKAVYLGPILFIAACVTVNVYFPAPAAEKAAEKIVKEIWGDEKPAEGGAEPGPQSLTNTSFLVAVLDRLSNTAYAAEADINVSTAAIRTLKTRMQERAKQLIPFMAQGVIGINNQGDLLLRNESGLPLKTRATMRRSIADENSDRAALYREIAAANGQPQWENNIRKVFSSQWRTQAHKGWWIQSDDGTWLQK